jgi:hypothetical protein
MSVADLDCEVRNFGVDHGTLEKLNLTRGAVQFPGTDTYQVGIEAYHQLHCLVGLSKNCWQIVQHVNNCIVELRSHVHIPGLL